MLYPKTGRDKLRKDLNLRVALQRVQVAVDAGGALRCHAALKEGVAVGVGVFSSPDVGIEGVCRRANRQLLWSHWLCCWYNNNYKIYHLLVASLPWLMLWKISEWTESHTNLCSMGASQSNLSLHGLLDAIDLLLVAAAVHHGALFGIPQCSLQGLNSLSSRPKTFLQLWKLTTQICIVTNQL